MNQVYFLAVSAFHGRRKQETTKFYFSFWTWTWFLGIQLPEGSHKSDEVSGYEWDWKKTNSFFKGRIRCRRALKSNNKSPTTLVYARALLSIEKISFL